MATRCSCWYAVLLLHPVLVSSDLCRLEPPGCGGNLLTYNPTGEVDAIAVPSRDSQGRPGTVSPAFADVSGDGIADLLLGASDGKVYRYLGDSNGSFGISGDEISGVFAYEDAAPAVVDLDGDGLEDLVVGCGEGGLGQHKGQMLRFRQNPDARGTFMADGFLSDLGVHVTGIDGIVVAPVFADLDSDGDYDCAVGSNLGTLQYFENTGTPTSPSFSKRTGDSNPFDSIDFGFSSHATFADMDNDGDLDLCLSYFDPGYSSTPLKYYEPVSTRRFVLLTNCSQTTLTRLSFRRNVGSASVPLFSLRSDDQDPFHGILAAAIASRPGMSAGKVSAAFLERPHGSDVSLVVAVNRVTSNEYPLVMLRPKRSDSFLLRSGNSSPITKKVSSGYAFYLAPTILTLQASNERLLVVGNGFGELLVYSVTNDENGAPILLAVESAANPFRGIDELVGTRTQRPYAPVFCDVSGDGHPDLILGIGCWGAGAQCESFEHKIEAYLFVPETGTFSKTTPSPLARWSGLQPAPACADVDGDGRSDVLVGSTGGELAFFLQLPNHTFALRTTAADDPFSGIVGSSSVLMKPAFTDFDGDGRVDLVLGHRGGEAGKLSVYLNTGEAETQAMYLEGSDPVLIDVGSYTNLMPSFVDVDDDGDGDLFLGVFENLLFFERSACTNDCLRRGVCDADTTFFPTCLCLRGKENGVRGQCEVCSDGFFGEDCAECPADDSKRICSSKGSCNDGIEGDGRCVCEDPAFSGSHCQDGSCDSSLEMLGVSEAGLVVCLQCNSCQNGSRAEASSISCICSPCAIGYYCPSTTGPPVQCEAPQLCDEPGLSGPKLCPAGFACATPLSAPQPCQPGFFSEKSQMSCTRCPSGSISIQGVACQSCPTGTTDLEGRGESCTECEVGRFAQQSNTVGTCEECPLGKVAKIRGRQQCTGCPVNHIPNDASDSCVACAPQTFARTGYSACRSCSSQTCSPGYGVSTTASDSQGERGAGCGECVKCLHGYHSPLGSGCEVCPTGKMAGNLGSANCTTCPPGWIAATTAATTCKECPGGRREVSNTACVACASDEYSFAGSDECTSCPTTKRGKPSCVDGQLNLVSEGIWFSITDDDVISASTEIHDCPCTYACITTPSNDTRTSFSVNCAEGYEGPLCAICSVGWVRSGDCCVECPSTSVSGALLGLCVLVFLTFLVYAVFYRSSKAGQLSKSKILVRIAINYAQMLASLALFRAHGTEAFKKAMGIVDSATSLNPLSIPPAECLTGVDYYSRLSLVLLLPLICFIFPALLLGPWYVARRLTTRAELIDRFLAASVFLVFLSYQPVGREALFAYQCRSIGTGVSYLERDYRVRCDTAIHTSFLVFATSVLCLFSLGFPLGLFLIMRRRRDRALDPHFAARFGFLYEGYRSDGLWWESVVLLRKLAFVAIAVLMNDPYIQIVCSLSLLSGSIALHIHYKPFSSMTINRIELVSLVAIYATQLASILYLSNGGATGESEAVEDLLSVFLIGLNTCVALLIINIILRFTAKIVLLQPGKMAKNGLLSWVAGRQSDSDFEEKQESDSLRELQLGVMRIEERTSADSLPPAGDKRTSGGEKKSTLWSLNPMINGRGD